MLSKSVSGFALLLDGKHLESINIRCLFWQEKLIRQYSRELSRHFIVRTNHRPAKPIRLIVGLLMLKHIRDLSDESVVEQ